MKTIYILHFNRVNSNGDTIHYIDRAYTNLDMARDERDRMNNHYESEPNFRAYVTGPILLYEKEKV